MQMRRVTRFQRLAMWTTATTYLLILVGGLVRASGAGLGCPDWPRCFGSWVPPLSVADVPAPFDPTQFNAVLMWTEYVNRLLGVTVGFLILATLVIAIRDHRRAPRILWPTALAFVLVGFEGWLGGVVVEHELASWIVTVHLLVALVIVSLLLYATVFAFFVERLPPRLGTSAPPDEDRPVLGPPSRTALMWTTLILIAVTLIQVTLGAQVRAGIDDAVAAGTPRVDALATVGAFDLWHRDAALVVFALVVIVIVQVFHVPFGASSPRPVALVRTAYVLAALVALQVAIGVSLVYVGLTPPAQVVHLTAASLLLGSETVLFLLARWLP
jgi:cytochrome c oxidase assembly protein subunit 15